MKRREYNEVYGYLPSEVINRLSSEERHKMFIEWLFTEPTETGWIIVRAVTTQLGDKFIKYLLDSIVDAMTKDGEEVTRESLTEITREMMTGFATDVNTLYEFVDIYRKEVLDKEESPEADPDQITKEMAMESKSKVLKRDAKGRFIKKK